MTTPVSKIRTPEYRPRATDTLSQTSRHSARGSRTRNSAISPIRIRNSKTMATNMASSQNRERPPSLLACIACRKKHLRCDARMPVCARCEVRGLDCSYVESRRGYKGPRKIKANDSKTNSSFSEETSQLLRESQDAPSSSRFRSNVFSRPGLSQRESDDLLLSNQELLTLSDHESSSGRSDTTQWVSRVLDPTHPDGAQSPEDDKLVNRFYKNFFPAHPFVIPRKFYVQASATIPEHLKRVMRFVASHYLPYMPQEVLRNSANLVFAENVVEDGFKVQSMLLLAMSSFARYEQVRGSEILEAAIDLALKLGMNNADFSARQAMTDPILAESWRRTYWDLYIVEGLISVLNGPAHIFRLQSVPCNVPLPGACEDYNQCRPQNSLRTLQDMQDRAFLNDDYPWSSFAYKVEAMRIMGTVMQLEPDTFATKDAQIEALDASISTFLLSLPVEKREVIERDGMIDEVLFGAHMIINWTSISLHRPRSSLTFVRNYYSTACTNEEVVGMPALAYASHNSKALRAANAISNLTAIQSPLSYHTPCYACAIALAATVHLPSCTLAETPEDQTRLKERLKLLVSALGTIGEVWPLAKIVKSQVAQFGREILIDPPSLPQLPRNSTLEPPQEALPAPFLQIDMDAMMSNESWLDELLFGAANPTEVPLSSTQREGF